MDAIAASRLLPTPFASPFAPPTLRTSSPSYRRLRIRTLASEPPRFRRFFFPVGFSFGSLGSLEARGSARRSEHAVEDDERVNTSAPESNLLDRIVKQTLLALFLLAIGFTPLRSARISALAAAPVAAEEVLNQKKNGREEGMKSKGHEYSSFTQRLLETVSGLIRSVEEVREGNGDLKQVEMELKAVKKKKEELQAEIMERLYSELRKLKREKGILVKQSEGLVDRVVKTKKEYDKVLGNADKKKKEEEEEEEDSDKVQRLEESLKMMEEEYNSVWERFGEIEDEMLRRETMALSFGVRELLFIERECKQLVENFSRQWRRKGLDRFEAMIF